MAAVARYGPDLSQEPHGSLTWTAVSPALGPSSAAFAIPLAGSRTGSGAAGT